MNKVQNIPHIEALSTHASNHLFVCLSDCKGNLLPRTEGNIPSLKDCIDGKLELA